MNYKTYWSRVKFCRGVDPSNNPFEEHYEIKRMKVCKNDNEHYDCTACM